MACSRKRFPGAVSIRLRFGKGNHLLWVAEPRDAYAEQQLAAELEGIREMREQMTNQVNDQVERSLKETKKRKLDDALAPGSSVPVIKPEPRNGLEPEPGSTISASPLNTPPDLEARPPSPSPADWQRLEPVRSGVVPLNTVRGPVHASEAEFTSLRQVGEQAEQLGGANKLLWELVDVLMEQKSVMQGRIKSLEWKVARGGGDVDHEVRGESLADREKDLIRRLGVPVMREERGLGGVGGARNV